MPEKNPIAKLKIVYQDPVNFKELYKFIYFWLDDNGYLSGKTSEADLEKVYSEQVRDGDVREYHIWWRSTKQPEDPYFKYALDVNFLVLGMKDTEVIKNDKKYKMQIGEVTISIISQLTIEANDKKGSWNKNPILKFVRPWYIKKWFRPKIEQYEDELYEETYKLQKAVKEFLELRQYESLEDIFYNKKGI